MDETAVAETVGRVLEGLDPDLVEYISGGVVDEGSVLPKEDLVDMVAPMLEELCDGDEEASIKKAEELWVALTGGKGAVVAEEPASRALGSTVRLGGVVDEEPVQDPKHKQWGGGLELADDSKTRARAEAEAKKAEAAKRAAAEAMAAEVSALAAELEAARIRAAKIRAEQGVGPLSALQIGPFQLPNAGGGPDLLEGAAAVLTPGHRYGLIGRNGTGKSTLLKAIAARRVKGLPEGLSMYYVNQEVTLSAKAEDGTPVDVVLEADIERRLLMEEEAMLRIKAEDGDPKAQERLLAVEERMEAIGAASARLRADKLLSNLGFTEELRARPMKALSGGWRVRTSLAAALFAKPDLLLLDEPTNHLSIDAVLWLAREIGTSATWDERVVVIVSHDRFFIDECCTHMMHISGVARRLTQSKGSYSQWAKRRQEQQKAWAKSSALRAQKRETLKEYTQHGYKYGGSTGQIAMQQKKLKEIEKMDVEAEAEAEELAALNEDAEVPLKLDAGGRLDRPAVQLDSVAFAYPQGAPLFTGVDLSVDSRSRIVLLGENGAGKTTLVKVLTGAHEPTDGLVLRASGARIAVVNQHHADQLDLDTSPLQFMLEKFPGDGSLAHEQILRGHLAQCGVHADLQGNLARGLSGGQRARVAMAAVSYTKPHILLLDEPTNNLDIEAAGALADCVQKFEGGVVLVSHDSFFVEAVAEEVLVVGDGKVTKVSSFAAYKKAILKEVAARQG